LGAKASDVAGVKASGFMGVKNLRQEVSFLRNEADNGDLRISENGAKQLRQALAEIKADVDAAIRDIEIDIQGLSLGSQEYGRIATEHTRKTFGGEPDSAAEVLGKFSQLLEELDETVQLAERKYAEQEDAAVNALRGAE